MSILNFMDTSFIIILGILILVTGLIMFYCYRRLNLLENSIIEHGKILQSFISNYNNQIMYSAPNDFFQECEIKAMMKSAKVSKTSTSSSIVATRRALRSQP